MKIDYIKLNNFKIYKGSNTVSLQNKQNGNISLIAGKNGFGKTTFLTSLIWSFYGNQMALVEDKYKKDIKSVGGYEKFLKSLINKTVLNEFENGKTNNATFFVEICLVDVLIPAIPCNQVIIRRSFDYKLNQESLSILIDGFENELTKDVGYEIFINDFILPREIAKFFFFDAEKIVTLAEAKSKNELKSLSKAYSEVLGIKKYEDLKLSLNALLTKLRRSGVSDLNKDKLNALIQIDNQLSKKIDSIDNQLIVIEKDISANKSKLDNIQEKLIREGNEITLDELKKLKQEQSNYKYLQQSAKSSLKKLLDIIPLVIAGDDLDKLIDQIKLESEVKSSQLSNNLLINEINSFSNDLLNEIKKKQIDTTLTSEIKETIDILVNQRTTNAPISNSQIILDYDDLKSRNILSIHKYIRESFKLQFNSIIKEEKNARSHLTRVTNKIKQAEARKNNPQAKGLRSQTLLLNDNVDSLILQKGKFLEELDSLKLEKTTNLKVLSEYEKNFNLIETDKKKYDVTVNLLNKLNVLISRIKEDKKYSLQKSILAGLDKLLHKDDFIANVNVRIEDDVMDIDLLDSNELIINKEDLSKGEQQLYATALLKALVDESGINFPVFIDSPLQKFDKEHSSNVISQFYPSISDQVVLFPLLEKELSFDEYTKLKKNLNRVYLLENNSNFSSLNECEIDNLFTKFNEQNYVLTN